MYMILAYYFSKYLKNVFKFDSNPFYTKMLQFSILLNVSATGSKKWNFILKELKIRMSFSVISSQLILSVYTPCIWGE